MKLKRLFILVVSLAFCLCGCGRAAPVKAPMPPAIHDSADYINVFGDLIKGAWIASVWNMDFPKMATTDDAWLQREIDEIVLKAKDNGINTLFLQVRPCADALYKSEIFPWSKFLTGTQGVAPNNNFDPLDYFIKRCHAADIGLHAWINPFRVTAVNTDKLVPLHPASLYPDLTFNIDGKLYFNPGEPAARELILGGVREIVRNYNVDGIHFDDYFYPEGITSEDSKTYQKHGQSIASIADWRRNNVDELVRQTYLTVKQENPNAVFGISPPGIWANKSSNPLGSDTRGFEAYSAIYADSRSWIKKGYVDYVAPQIYWYIGQPGSDFLTVFKWWESVCKDTNVALLTGIAGYKAGTGGAWNNVGEFANQIQLSCEDGHGFIIFSFGNI